MARKLSGPGETEARAGARERLRRDLEARGVDPLFADAVLSEVEIGTATVESRKAILDGVEVAYRVHCGGQDDLTHAMRDLNEVARLMEDFAGELGKLDESLKTLSAFLTRMKACVSAGSPPHLH